MRYPLSLIVSALLFACSAGEPDTPPDAPPVEGGQTPTPEQKPEVPSPDEPEAGGPVSGESNAGTYRVTWESDPHPVPLNDTFTLDVHIEDAQDENGDVESIQLAADAAMPDHAHGMNRTPRVTRIGPGHFRVEGMLFHMPGYWELYFDISRGPLRERAQFPIELE